SIEGRSLKLNSAADVQPFVDSINAIHGLTEIRLSGNTFGVEAARAIAAALKDKHELRVIGFSDMFTGRLKDEIPLALDAFVEAFEDKVHLEVLDLSDNAFGPAGAKPLMKLLTNNRNIQILRLNNNGLGIEGGRLISEALVAAGDLNKKASTPSSLRVVVAGRNRLESKGAEYLSAAFRAHAETLREVRMPQNSIRPEGVTVLVEALATCSHLDTLDLQDNTFTQPGSEALARSLPSWPGLRVLNVGDCLLSAPGGLAVIQALTEAHTNLERLNLAFGEIDEAGAKIAADMLANKSKLESIELNGNAFKAESDVVQAIRDALRVHGHADALDELDEMDVESEDEEEGEEE
ncbi:hypothetical protein BDK51DRAFT_11404, partial [Blyttiomyces helicus]